MTESIIRNSWSSVNSVITYNYLLLSEGDAGTLDASSGVWTTNVPGLYGFYKYAFRWTIIIVVNLEKIC